MYSLGDVGLLEQSHAMKNITTDTTVGEIVRAFPDKADRLEMSWRKAPFF
jgi:hypothetical protein